MLWMRFISQKCLTVPVAAWTVSSIAALNKSIWANKQALVNTVNTQITQMVMRGAVPDNAIKAIADRFKVSKS